MLLFDDADGAVDISSLSLFLIGNFRCIDVHAGVIISCCVIAIIFASGNNRRMKYILRLLPSLLFLLHESHAHGGAGDFLFVRLARAVL